MAPFLHSLFLNLKIPSSPVNEMREFMLTKEYAGKYIEAKPKIEPEFVDKKPETAILPAHNTIVDKKENWISPKQNDTLFWCLYSIHYGHNDYKQVGRNYGIRLLEVKKEIGEWIQKTPSKMKQTNYKITKASVQEIMSECLTSPRDTSPLSLLAYLSFFNMNAVIMNESEKLAIKFVGCVDAENPTYLLKRDAYGRYKIKDEPLTPDELTALDNTCFILDNYERPLKSISNYKTDQLETLAKKMGVFDAGKKYKKADIYALVYEACKFSITPTKGGRH
jgi:hypothetical protein